MKKDPQEVMIDVLGDLLEKASKAQEREAHIKIVLWTLLIVTMALGYTYFFLPEVK